MAFSSFEIRGLGLCGQDIDTGMGLPRGGGGLNPLQPGEVPGTERYLAKATSVFGLEIASQKVGQTSLLLSQRYGQLEDKFLCEIWNSRAQGAREACGPVISSEWRACQPL